MNKIILFAILSTSWAHAFDHTHKVWTELLQKYVTSSEHASTYNYKAHKQKRQSLDNYLATLSAVNFSEYKTFTRDQQLAFMMNAYNAFTIKFILDYYPVKSIKCIKSGILPCSVNNPWDKLTFQFLGKETSLTALEHTYIRKLFNEPRIHFAINCASVGCPALDNNAYTDKDLEEMLKKATVRFLTDRSRNYLDEETNTIYLSKIFDWFKSDFTTKYGNLQTYVLPFLIADKTKYEKYKSMKLKIDHTEYDWNLNETSSN